jgi:hypothetical protein
MTKPMGIYKATLLPQSKRLYEVFTPQEAGGEDGLEVMTGAVGWYQIHQTNGFHGFQVFDAIPCAPFRPLL